MHTGKKLLAGVVAAATGATALGVSISAASAGSSAPTSPSSQIAASNRTPTATPIKHVVVLFDENVSFDHYFGTYPYAENRPGETPFKAAANTPTVNGLGTTLLEANPNQDDPQRLSPDQALTCDQNHAYTPEQSAFDGGLMDRFVESTTGGGCTESNTPDNGGYGPNGIVMDYYDGNTVTGLWNLAQRFTLNDNFYGTQFGPSSPGAVNVISGDTYGAVAEGGSSSAVTGSTLNGDVDPYFDECSNGSAPASGPGEAGGVTAEMTGRNIGDLLNAKDLTWGWFEGGFTPSSYTSGGQPICGAAHTNIGGASVADYVPHHEPFQYYASTSNPLHLSPDSLAQVGTNYPSGVNHQYDLSWFNRLAARGELPAVSYLKAPASEDGHAGYSDPLDEQRFIATEVDAIERSKDWPSTAIFIAWDDSDGWYDHQMGPIIRGSQTPQDTLNGTGECGATAISNLTTQDRCGVGPRMPLLVISPWAKQNYVDNTFAEQASIPAFIEDNWDLGRIGNGSADAAAGTLDNAFDFNQRYGTAPAVILNPTTGAVEQTIPAPAPAAASTGTQTAPSETQPAATTVDSSGSSAPSVSHAGGGSATSGPAPAPRDATTGLTAPATRLTTRATKRTIRLTVRIRGGSDVATSIRLRLRRGRRLVLDRAARVRGHRVEFTIRRGTRMPNGRYRATVTVDAGGTVASTTRMLRIAA
ncbi:MAG TPA: alkaline phosphatase family protein [Solirubrobacteraceae bacterium]|nr:alkaline phosphatase family protein [Solirubrobacteraceae bacterium]